MSYDRDRLQRKLAELQAELDELTNVDPQFRQRLEQTLQELQDAMAQTTPSSGGSDPHPGLAQRLTESARHFEETHPNLSGMIGSVIDALGRMGI
jgi:TolA-binding protein